MVAVVLDDKDELGTITLVGVELNNGIFEDVELLELEEDDECGWYKACDLSGGVIGEY